MGAIDGQRGDGQAAPLHGCGIPPDGGGRNPRRGTPASSSSAGKSSTWHRSARRTIMVIRLTRLLPGALAGRGVLSVQNPVRLDDGSEPEPDVAVPRPRADDYATATPCPPDVPLLIEVADSSLAGDRAIKLPLYAESGIAECWIVNLVERVVEVYRQPRDGRFADFRRVSPGEVLDVALLPGVALPVADVFPPMRLTAARRGVVAVAEIVGSRSGCKRARPDRAQRGCSRVQAPCKTRASLPPPIGPRRISDCLRRSTLSKYSTQRRRLTLRWHCPVMARPRVKGPRTGHDVWERSRVNL